MLTDATGNKEASIYCGYLNVKQIKATDSYPDLTWACAVADKFKETVPAPVYNAEDSENPYYSSGWYLPSIKQLEEIYLLYKLNLFFEKADGTNFRNSGEKDVYWSSSEYFGSGHSQNAFNLNFYKGPSTNSVQKGSSSTWSYVRSVLTF